MPAILALLAALAPLIPTLSQQIMQWVDLFKQKGALTKDQQDAVHALAVQVHAEVQRLIAARTNP